MRKSSKVASAADKWVALTVLEQAANSMGGDLMAELVYRPGQRRHLFAVRHLLPDPDDKDCYVAGALVAVYTATDPMDVSRQANQEAQVVPPYAVVHVTGYMLALAHQGQEGFRVWVVESGGRVHEQYVTSVVDMVRGEWRARRTL
jgi:hypothetical protein